MEEYQTRQYLIISPKHLSLFHLWSFLGQLETGNQVHGRGSPALTAKSTEPPFWALPPSITLEGHLRDIESPAGSHVASCTALEGVWAGPPCHHWNIGGEAGHGGKYYPSLTWSTRVCDVTATWGTPAARRLTWPDTLTWPHTLDPCYDLTLLMCPINNKK